MDEPVDDTGPADIDRAYRAASDAQAATPAFQAAAARRRRAVLAAVAGLPTPAIAQPAVAAASPRSRGWWPGLAAACVLLSSSLLVLRLQHDPEAGVGDPRRAALEDPTPPVRAAPAPEPALADTAPAPVTPASPRTTSPPAQPTRPARSPQTAAAPPAPAPAPEPSPAPVVAEAATAPAPAADGLVDRPAQPTLANKAEGAAIGPATASARIAGNSRRAGLLAAAAARDYTLMESLLAAGSPIDAERDAEGRSALAQAVLRGDARLVKWLLEHGADPRLPDRQGLSPQDHALARGQDTVLQVMGLR